jgi:hypothetical protein
MSYALAFAATRLWLDLQLFGQAIAMLFSGAGEIYATIRDLERIGIGILS